MTIVVTMKDGDGKYILSNSEVGAVGGVQTLTAKLIGSKTFFVFFFKDTVCMLCGIVYFYYYFIHFQIFSFQQKLELVIFIKYCILSKNRRK